jgi:membrane fusion protein (multidrug efflux system)
VIVESGYDDAPDLETHGFGDQMARKSAAGCLLLTFLSGLLSAEAEAQPASGGPPAVGVVRAERQQMTQTDEFIGRIQAVGRVALVARVSAFLEQRLFDEGAEVKNGDLLYPLSNPFSGAGSV